MSFPDTFLASHMYKNSSTIVIYERLVDVTRTDVSTYSPD